MLPVSPRGTGLPLVVQDLDLVAGHGEAGRAGLDPVRLQPHGVGHDGPARLGLPPVVHDGHVQHLGQPLVGGRVQALARQEQGAQGLEMSYLRLRWASGSSFLMARNAVGAVKNARHLVVLDHPPERAGVRRAHGLALVQHGGAAVDQRPVDDVAVAHDPAHVRRGPEHLARVDVVDGLHGVLQGHGVAAVVAHDALGLPGGAGGVEDVQGIGRLHRHAGRRLGVVHQLVPVQVAPGGHGRLGLGPREDDDVLGRELRPPPAPRPPAACRG